MISSLTIQLSIRSIARAPYRRQRFIGVESGQALVEMLVIVIICLIMAVGMYEAGAFLHNISVLNAAVDHAATYVAWGAPIERVEQALITEGENLLTGAFLQQKYGQEGLIVEIWNPVTNEKIAPTEWSETLMPRRKHVAEYIFWAQGYEARVGIRYRAGIYIPFVGPVTIPLTTIASARTIQAPNDIDRDGMVDHYEAEYVGWALAQSGDGPWIHPVHRDGVGEFDSSQVDIDGDGMIAANDTFPYDYNNNGIEDKFDPNNNLMIHNPVLGPAGFISSPP